MFLFIDPSGLVTWEWKKTDKKVNRKLSFGSRDNNGFIHLTYCSLHNCYFGLNYQNAILVINRQFEVVFKTENGSSSIFCMIYNPLTDELITSGVDGVKLWCLVKSDKEQIVSLKQMSNYELEFKYTLFLLSSLFFFFNLKY